MNREVVARELVGCAFKVHSTLGPGLLESAYELADRGIEVKRQKLLPIHYGGVSTDAGYGLDLLLDDQIVVELKAVNSILPVHEAQLLSYLKLGHYHLGFLLNFNVGRMKAGICRMLNGYQP